MGRSRPGFDAAPGTESDDALLARSADGDDDAWRELVERHLNSVHGYAWHMLNDRTEAEDIAQETFVRLMRKAPDWRPGGARLRTWLYRVAINLCIDHRRRAAPAEPLDRAMNVADPAAGSMQVERSLDLTRHVRAALQQLSERQRTAITLVHYQGFSNGEAAELMDSSVEAVESLLARGRRQLRENLAPYAHDLLGEH